MTSRVQDDTAIRVCWDVRRRDEVNFSSVNEVEYFIISQLFMESALLESNDLVESKHDIEANR